MANLLIPAGPLVTLTLIDFAFSFVCILAIPFFIPIMSERIFSPYAGSVWHNESYLGMRFMAVLILLNFYRTNETYLKRFSLKDFFISSLLFLYAIKT